jgi:hypothetical protein
MPKWIAGLVVAGAFASTPAQPGAQAPDLEAEN